MAIIDQLKKSDLSLLGNGFNPQPHSPAWGYVDASGNLDPAASSLQNTYSVNGNPNVKLKDFNKNGKAIVNADTRLDELDARAPKLTPRGVVSQAYKSKTGSRYKDLGPAGGRY
jgi:hypothetical protein